ncbi:response regulator [Fulvivirga sp. M361]|uniref:ATP-binding response regulator n=1 Tax=Fulvivirga sp. M361 TaxID=2594266 RepID=UPI00117B585F|nr:hybrid sensor histidine kinase/response regulator [Fulvivirga sp. M361]TRX52382.1 response regulator [Fulvivirga sp. M361]
MNIEKYKSDYLNRRMQLVLFERETGNILYSSDTLIRILNEDTVFNVSPFLESLQSTFATLAPKDQLVYSCVNIPYGGRDFYFDLIFDVPSDSPDMMVWQLFDFTDHYENLTVVQQERNESEISRETQLLENERVRHENELLKFKNEEMKKLQKAKTQFFSQVNHEIRNPVNAIAGLTTVLSKSNSISQIKGHIKALHSVSSHLINLVSNVLDLSKIESGNLKVECDDFELKPLVDAVIQAFKYTALEKGVHLEYTIERQLPEKINGDMQKLSQVLYNLVGNAIKFTHSGYVKMHVNLIDVIDNRLCIAFKVEDTGVGIPKNMYDEIFKPYKQGMEDTTRKYGGTGLGLSITKELIELMEGQIYVESEVNVGSTFRFVLPFDFHDEKEALIDPKHKALPSENVSNVLIVEDDPINGMILEEVLQEEGLTTHLVTKTQEAIEAITDYDLVITDYHLGEETCIPILELLEQQQSTLPVLVVSGEHQATLTKTIKRYSNALFLQKPLQVDKVKSRVNQLLGSRTAEQYDLTPLRKIYANDQQKFRQVLHMLCSEISASTHQMLENMDTKDFAGIKNLSHKLKTHFSFVGMREPYHELTIIETELRKGIHLGLKARLESLHSNSETVVEQIRTAHG